MTEHRVGDESSNPVFALLSGAGPARDEAVRQTQQRPLRLFAMIRNALDQNGEAVRGIVRLLSEPDPSLREAAAQILLVFNKGASVTSAEGLRKNAMADPRWEEALTAALSDPSPQVRTAGLLVLRAPEAARVGEWVTAALSDSAELVRCEAIRAVAKIGAPDAAKQLEDRLQDDSSKVRGSAIFQLGQMRSKESVPALLQLLTSADELTARQAISALGSIGDPRAFEGLCSAVRRGIPAAANSIGMLKDERVLGFLLSVLDGPDASGTDHHNALLGLSHLRHPDAIPRLIELAEDPVGDGGIRQYAARALGRHNNPKARAWLESALERKDLQVMVAAGLTGIPGPWYEKVEQIIDDLV